MRSLIFSCVCLLALLSPAADKTSTDSHEISIANLQFKPAALSIKVGDTVVWTNDDDRDHTVIAQDGAFASSLIRRGEMFSFKFDRAGKYPYGCKLHPRMKGTIVVVPQK